MKYYLLLLLIIQVCWSKPHWNQNLIALEKITKSSTEDLKSIYPRKINQGIETLRIQVDWSRVDGNEIYKIVAIEKEFSGTQSFLKRSTSRDKLGSYRAELIDPEDESVVYHSSIGTGMEYRLLTRAMSFRFPMVTKDMRFKMWAEHPISGEMEIVVNTVVSGRNASEFAKEKTQSWVIKKSDADSKLIMTFYAEGYKNGSENKFLEVVRKSVSIIEDYPFPLKDKIEVHAIFAQSNNILSSARNLGLPVKSRDSFLGLYFPYWNSDMGRWYHILYPTDELKFRRGLAHGEYDYPVILVDNDDYWGVGNYNSHTALPANNIRSYKYLFLHEFGHFMGLNEEYHEPAPNRTELTFAPGIYEPWSQNTTFLRYPAQLKWAHQVASSTPIPTPTRFGSNKIGAYKGGYSSAPGLNHKPSLNCVMESKQNFCSVCLEGIETKLLFDLGYHDEMN